MYIHAFATCKTSSAVHVTALPIVVHAVDVVDIVSKRGIAEVQHERAVRSRRDCLRQVIGNGSGRVEASAPVLFQILFLKKVE